jgi:hypothetical protein
MHRPVVLIAAALRVMHPKLYLSSLATILALGLWAADKKLDEMGDHQSAHESQESKENDTGLSREKSPQAYTSSQKGKGREVVPGENEDDAVEVKWGRATC